MKNLDEKMIISSIRLKKREKEDYVALAKLRGLTLSSLIRELLEKEKNEYMKVLSKIA